MYLVLRKYKHLYWRNKTIILIKNFYLFIFCLPEFSTTTTVSFSIQDEYDSIHLFTQHWCWPVNDLACMLVLLCCLWQRCLLKSVITIDSRCSCLLHVRAQHYMPGGFMRQHGRVHPAVGKLHLRLLHDFLLWHPVQRSWVTWLHFSFADWNIRRILDITLSLS